MICDTLSKYVGAFLSVLLYTKIYTNNNNNNNNNNNVPEGLGVFPVP